MTNAANLAGLAPYVTPSGGGVILTNTTLNSPVISGATDGSALTSLNASNLASGTVPTARLGSGTANTTTFLRGDNSWAVVDSLPSQSGQSGKYLTTDGSVASWATVSGGGVTSVNGQTGAVTGLATDSSFTQSYNGSPAVNGWKYLNGGLLWQWGYIGTGTNGSVPSSGTITLPITYLYWLTNPNMLVRATSGATSVRLSGITGGTSLQYQCFSGATLTTAAVLYWSVMGY